MSRPVCALLPGMLCTPELWPGQEAALHPVAEVVHVRLRAPSISGMAAEILSQPYEQMVLIGLSLGGIAAMAAARVAPRRVAGLVLASTNARGPRPDQRAAWTRLRQRVAAGEFGRITAEDLLPGLLHPQRQADLGGVVTAMADRTGPEVFLAQLAAQESRIDERPWLAELRCPALVLAARDDALCPPERHEEIAGLIPGAQLEVLNDTGHLSPLERPAEVAGLLRDWVGALAAGQHRTAQSALTY